MTSLRSGVKLTLMKKKEQIQIDKKLKEILKNGTLLTFSDGCKYTGMTKPDPKNKDKLIPEGLGFAMWSDGQSYKGQYKNGTFDGWGNYKVPGSHELIGIWKEGFITSGEMKFEDGRHYVGEFKNSKHHGNGTMNYSGNKEYEGQWKDGDVHGKGKLTYLKNYEQQEKGTIYEGTFKNGNQHGEFIITFPDGDILESTYVNGQRTKHKWRD